jgi:hypothetical protein
VPPAFTAVTELLIETLKSSVGSTKESSIIPIETCFGPASPGANVTFFISGTKSLASAVFEEVEKLKRKLLRH